MLKIGNFSFWNFQCDKAMIARERCPTEDCLMQWSEALGTFGCWLSCPPPGLVISWRWLLSRVSWKSLPD